MNIRPEFVSFIPDRLEERVLYVSMEYATVIHACLCGCGGRVVTPLAPNRWQLRFDGKSVSLSPSVGNWSFPCQSHYWIDRNQVVWADRFSRAEVEVVRANDRAAMAEAWGEGGPNVETAFVPDVGPIAKPSSSWWRRWLSRLTSS